MSIIHYKQFSSKSKMMIRSLFVKVLSFFLREPGLINKKLAYLFCILEKIQWIKQLHLALISHIQSLTRPCSFLLAAVCQFSLFSLSAPSRIPEGKLPYTYYTASLLAQLVKNPPAMREAWVWCLGWKDPLEKGKVTHSSILAWRIPWTV